jgi:hypothetical protein
MRLVLITSTALLLMSLGAPAAETQKLYRWVDREGIVHYGDTIPAEYADIERQVINDHGITVDVMRGKKSPKRLPRRSGRRSCGSRSNFSVAPILRCSPRICRSTKSSCTAIVV